VPTTPLNFKKKKTSDHVCQLTLLQQPNSNFERGETGTDPLARALQQLLPTFFMAALIPLMAQAQLHGIFFSEPVRNT